MGNEYFTCVLTSSIIGRTSNRSLHRIYEPMNSAEVQIPIFVNVPKILYQALAVCMPNHENTSAIVIKRSLK